MEFILISDSVISRCPGKWQGWAISIYDFPFLDSQICFRLVRCSLFDHSKSVIQCIGVFSDLCEKKNSLARIPQGFDHEAIHMLGLMTFSQHNAVHSMHSFPFDMHSRFHGLLSRLLLAGAIGIIVDSVKVTHQPGFIVPCYILGMASLTWSVGSPCCWFSLRKSLTLTQLTSILFGHECVKFGSMWMACMILFTGIRSGVSIACVLLITCVMTPSGRAQSSTWVI